MKTITKYITPDVKEFLSLKKIVKNMKRINGFFLFGRVQRKMTMMMLLVVLLTLLTEQKS